MGVIREVYIDGSANNLSNAANSYEGGWAFVELQGNEILHQASGHVKNTTNNRMELTALLEAIKHYKSAVNHDDVVVFYTDSQYVQKSATIWLESWLKNNWKNGKVKNQDLWEEYLALNDGTLKFKVQWVKGHSNVKGNIIADALANNAFNNR